MTMALSDIVAPKWDNLLSNSWMATDKEHMMWTALATISRAFVVMSKLCDYWQSINFLNF
jgi:hypothetical protein